MKLEAEVVLACFVTLILIQQGLCDDFSDTSEKSNWTCTCSSVYPGKQSDALKYNCSTSCDCSPVEPNGDRWKCTCATDGFPKVAIDNHDTNCFTACNCTAGSLTEAPERKNYANRVVVIVLLLCVILTTLAFLASLTCYFYRKDKCPKCPIKPAVFSSDKETSCNSATNLISHKISLESETKVDTSFPTKPVAGCFQMASFLCWSKTGTVLGTICQFAYSELENATNKFSNSNLIGFGGSSYVYQGQLKDGRIVAVKRLKIQGGDPDADSIFSTEVELLSRLHHCHVVPLLGYCSEFSGKHAERLLVFEYMPNGNLRDCLDGILGETMSWETRVAIAIGAARGLEYLHEAAAPRILHRDVKSTNILLDKNWRAKITDLVLLELITGRQPIHKSNNREESLVIWATPRLQDSKRVTLELPDSRLKGNFPEEEMQVMAYLAKECLLLDPDARPTMSEVVQILSTIASDKSKRRNIPVNFYQMSSSNNIKNEALFDRHQTVIEDLYDTEEHMPSTSKSAESSPPSDMNDIGIVSKQIGTLPAECMERLVLLSSNATSLHVLDDEAVDLIEPRFESFHMENVKCP
ncbi:hypothetical protein V6N13_058826 [Hibiscus sabdariffa]